MHIKVSDRIVVLHTGRIVESGSPERVTDRPEHPYQGTGGRGRQSGITIAVKPN
ncbi:MAG: hypothetical protein U1D96_09700 [Eubacteriales bacterium]|jgi:ABC-type glutathione transport system ATPase component|nr:hypothetical protein [Bacillota bacterium]MBV1727599.1 hypothetical protein [Desulforudis sp.]MDQ7790472.1 hypothetical protein [Clostridia bacterium]MDZ4043739.1 hypothetical protein [Eubacteriales bacterium]MBU4532844.1 hypothetical protein [Bacillota bacterium]